MPAPQRPVEHAAGRHRIVFMGTPEFAVPSLRRLIEREHVVGVFTQPDRPAGRGRQVQMSPVKVEALTHDLPVRQPASLRRDPAAVADLAGLEADAIVVAAYGLLLPPAALTAARLGAVNVHASLLPRWRGAAPVSHAILAGDAVTGVSIMVLDSGLDTGPVLARAPVEIGPAETAGALTARLAEVGAGLLVDVLPPFLGGTLEPVPQDGALATLAPRLAADDGHLVWSEPAAALARRVRAMDPWPGAFTELADRTRLKILAATAVVAGLGERGAGSPGTVSVHDRMPEVNTGDGRLRLDIVQQAGRKAMSGADFLRGRPDVVGTCLGATAAVCG